MKLLQRFKKDKSLLTQPLNPKSFTSIFVKWLSYALMVLGGVALGFYVVFDLHTENLSEYPVKSELTRLLVKKEKEQPLESPISSSLLDEVLPQPSIQKDYLEAPNKEIFQKKVGDPGFPPDGDKLLTLRALIFFENQRRYEPVRLELIRWGDSIYLAGAGMCEVVQSKYVLLKPCIFRDKIVDDLSSGSASNYEVELIQSLNFYLTLPFEPFARHITSSLECETMQQYKLTVQYLGSAKEGYISINVPFTTSEVDAVGELIKNSKNSCAGLDLFFEPEIVLHIYSAIEEVRASIIKRQ